MIENDGERERGGEPAIRKCGCLWAPAWTWKMEILIQTNGNGSREAQPTRTQTHTHREGLLGNQGTSGMDGPTPDSSWSCQLDPPV
uniref:IP17040p1 n=2 Tax=Drosophila melanogaster TaxID=7227 RepID=E1JH75_DROME|eukprot:NP_001163160.1 uncharacterized protein Dmel_CG42524, isoform A [Drosophila melanogaster]